MFRKTNWKGWDVMNIFKMELAKILKRKSTWVITALLAGLIIAHGIMELSQAQRMIVSFGRLAGVRRFLDLTEILITYGMIGEILMLSSFYCEDRYYGVDVLLSVTAKGKLYDFIARVQVTFTIIFSVHTMMVLAAWLIGLICYGYPEHHFLMREMYVWGPFVSDQSSAVFIAMYLGSILAASIIFASFIVCISTVCRKPVNALVITVAVLLFPAVLEGVFKNGDMNAGYIFVTGQPLMLVVWRVLEESWPVYGWHIIAACMISIIGFSIGGKKWCSVSS